MALYWLDVSNISRRAAPGTMQAHGNYVLRESARNHVVAVNFPTNKHAIKRELREYEEWAEAHTRKDARLVYKIMHALPRELNRRGQIEATRRFLWQLTMKGKARGFAAFHDLNSDNPHVHICFIDRDASGKSVALLSASKKERAARGLEPNSTEWLRQLWEIECNGVLAEQGLEVRIDRRTNLERGLTAAREQHRGWQDLAHESARAELTENQRVEDQFEDTLDMVPELVQPTTQLYDEIGQLEPAPECPPMPGDASPDDDYGDALSEPEEDMAETDVLTPKQKAMAASQFYDELRLLRHLRAKLDGYTMAVESAITQVQTAKAESHTASLAFAAADQQKFAAEERLKQYQSERGLRGAGFSVGIGKWKLEWKSALRKEGEQALSKFEALSNQYEHAQHVRNSTNFQVERWTNAGKEQLEKRDAAQHEVDAMLSQFGQRATLESAEQTLNHTAHTYVADISVEDLKDLFETEQITTSTYRDALELKGETGLIQELDEAIESGDVEISDIPPGE